MQSISSAWKNRKVLENRFKWLLLHILILSCLKVKQDFCCWERKKTHMAQMQHKELLLRMYSSNSSQAESPLEQQHGPESDYLSLNHSSASTRGMSKLFNLSVTQCLSCKMKRTWSLPPELLWRWNELVEIKCSKQNRSLHVCSKTKKQKSLVTITIRHLHLPRQIRLKSKLLMKLTWLVETGVFFLDYWKILTCYICTRGYINK